MSLQQYNSLMSNLLKERCSLTKLREELEGKKRKLCRSCKKFRHLMSRTGFWRTEVHVRECSRVT